MNFTKRMLAVFLAFALELTFTWPALAEEETPAEEPSASTVNWDNFYITAQPQDLTITHGESFTLSAAVNVPAGVEVEYQWYRRSSDPIEGATASELHLGPDDPHYPLNDSILGGLSADYQIQISAFEKDAANNVIPEKRLKSDWVRVETKRTILGKLFDITIAPFGYALTAVLLMLPLAFIFPISYPAAVIYFFIQGFKNLFS